MRKSWPWRLPEGTEFEPGGGVGGAGEGGGEEAAGWGGGVWKDGLPGQRDM